MIKKILKWPLKNRIVFSLICYSYDVLRELRYVGWSGRTNYCKLSSEMIFYYHKIEKGLSLPAVREFFGKNVVYHVVSLVERWRKMGYDRKDEVYIAALTTLSAYYARFASVARDSDLEIIKRVETCLNDDDFQLSCETTQHYNSKAKLVYDDLYQLALCRRSVRNFSRNEVSQEVIDKAVILAQQSPSACNRQPVNLLVVSDKEMISKIVYIQGGSRGFGERAAAIGIVMANLNSYFDASERIGPMVDCGLFTMSFLLGLHSQGVSTCCLNWCVAPWTDLRFKRMLKIDQCMTVACLIAIGYSSDHTVVPRSTRRAIDNVRSFY